MACDDDLPVHRAARWSTLGCALALLAGLTASANAQVPDGNGEPQGPGVTVGSDPDASTGSEPEDPSEVREPTPAETREARAIFREGVQFAQKDLWTDALERFRRSNELVPRPTTEFNIAVALTRLGRPVEALEALETYLRHADTPGEAGRRREARKLLDITLASIAHLYLTVTPETAVVEVDGVARLSEGVTRHIRVDPGDRVIRVTAPDHEPATLTIELSSGAQIERSIELVPIPKSTSGQLTITTTVPSAVIHVNRDAVGTGTYVGELPAGRHHVEVLAEGYVPFRRMVEIKSGGRAEVHASLTQRDQGTLLESPWLWVGAGVIVAGALVGALLVAGGSSESPYGGTTGVVLPGLRTSSGDFSRGTSPF